MQKEKSDIMRELKEQNNFWSHKKKSVLLKDLKIAVISWVSSHLEDVPKTHM